MSTYWNMPNPFVSYIMTYEFHAKAESSTETHNNLKSQTYLFSGSTKKKFTGAGNVAHPAKLPLAMLSFHNCIL